MSELTGKIIPCENCGKEIYRTPYRLQKVKHHFCSNQCQFEYQHRLKFEDRPCAFCGKLFHVSKLSSQRFCSQRCNSDWQKTLVGDLNPRTNRVTLTCAVCGREFEKVPSVAALTKNHFCSNTCRREWYASTCSQTPEWKEASRLRAVRILESGAISLTNSKPQLIVNDMLDNLGIQYRNEESFKYYAADNYLVDYNLVIEVMGDFWHCSPFKYSKDKAYAHQLHTISRDKAKHTYILNYHGIEILYLWETDIDKNPDVCERLIVEYVNNAGVLDNYHSFNYHLADDGQLCLNASIIVPYQQQESIRLTS